MEILKIVLTILFVIDGIALTIIVLLQEGKSAGLGSIAGGAVNILGTEQGTFYGSALVKSTKFLACLFMILAAALNLGVFN